MMIIICYHSHLFKINSVQLMNCYYNLSTIILLLFPIPLKLSFYVIRNGHVFYHRFRCSKTCYYLMNFTRMKTFLSRDLDRAFPSTFLLSMVADFFF